MQKKYQVLALYSSDEGNQRESTFSESVGFYYSELSAHDAMEDFEGQEDAPNFLSCCIQYIGDVLE